MSSDEANKSTAIAQRIEVQNLCREAEQLSQAGQLDAALACLYQALTIRPSIDRVMRALGDTYRRAGKPEEANLCFRGALPEAAEARYLCADKLRQRIRPAHRCHNARDHQAFAAEQWPLSTPANNRGHDFPQFRRSNTDCAGSFTTVVANGEAWFDRINTLVLDRERCMLEPHIKGNPFATFQALSAHAPTVMPGRVCLLDARSSGIYYHWLLDVLPKLEVLRVSGIQIDSIDTFLVRTEPGFARQTLSACGVDPERVCWMPEGVHIRAGELVVPFLKNDLGQRVYHGLGLGMGSWVPAWLQSVFCPDAEPGLVTRATATEEAIDADGTTHRPHRERFSGKRLLISRPAGTRRSLANEAQLWPHLQSRGFERVQLETLDVPAQARLMRACELVVACHGAGLANLAFCRPGTCVLEVFGDYIVPCYWALASLARLEYHQFMTIDPAAGTEPMAREATVRQNELIEVPIDSFLGTLDLIL